MAGISGGMVAPFARPSICGRGPQTIEAFPIIPQSEAWLEFIERNQPRHASNQAQAGHGYNGGTGSIWPKSSEVAAITAHWQGIAVGYAEIFVCGGSKLVSGGVLMV
jgi:hypothetical protein